MSIARKKILEVMKEEDERNTNTQPFNLCVRVDNVASLNPTYFQDLIFQT